MSYDSVPFWVLSLPILYCTQLVHVSVCSYVNTFVGEL